MHTVNIHDAKTQLSRLIERVEHGEQITIARAGSPVAVLVPYRAERRPIAPPGSLIGQDWTMADDFDASLDPLFTALRPRP